MKEAKKKLVIMSEELFDIIGRATFVHNISANALTIISIEYLLKKKSPELYKEYRQKLKERNQKALIQSKKIG